MTTEWPLDNAFMFCRYPYRILPYWLQQIYIHKTHNNETKKNNKENIPKVHEFYFSFCLSFFTFLIPMHILI